MRRKPPPKRFTPDDEIVADAKSQSLWNFVTETDDFDYESLSKDDAEAARSEAQWSMVGLLQVRAEDFRPDCHQLHGLLCRGAAFAC
jgi:hypothetical protein